MTDDFPEILMDAMRESARQKFGMDKMTVPQLFKLAHKVIDILPVKRLEDGARELAATGRETDRLMAEQIGILLFARHEMNERLLNRTPEQMIAMFREIVPGGGADS